MGPVCSLQLSLALCPRMGGGSFYKEYIRKGAFGIGLG